MSDRIYELVGNIEDGLHGKCGFTLSESSLNNLATIAREANERALKAEAMCEWLADKCADMNAHTTFTDDSGDWEGYWLAAARGAVSK